MNPIVPIDMYNMVGCCPENILMDELRFAFRNSADASDTEVIALQQELLRFLSEDLLKLPAHTNEGIVLHSGSEANEVALMLAKRATSRRYVIASNLSHSSIENAGQKLGLETVRAEVCRPEFKVSANDLNDMLKKHGKDVALLNITYGTTKLGTDQDFLFDDETMHLLKKYDIWVHVDAAYGGFMLSLLPSEPPAWRGLPNLRSITVDTHKFVGALGCGVLLLPDHKDKRHMGGEVVYFEGNASALGTTRSAYPLATALACIKHFGTEGLSQLAQECRAKAAALAERIEPMGFKLLVPVEAGVVPVALPGLKDIDELSVNLARVGYKVSPINIPFTEGNTYGFRVVVTPKKEMTQPTLDGFAQALEKTVLKR